MKIPSRNSMHRPGLRILMLAMSGIRVQDSSLLELGLTLPGFVERGRAVASLPSLGLLTLAGMTGPEHEVEYLEVADLRVLDELPTGYDLIAISTLSAQVNDAYDIAARFIASGTPVVLGGLHATACPEEVAAHGLIAVAGEGELAWPRILRDAQAGTLLRIYDVRQREFDLADAPLPAYHLLEPDRYNRYTVQTSRGCPWKCEFCASSIMLTRRYKQKPIAKVLAEIDAIRARWPRPFLELADDNSFVNRKYWLELLPELARRHLRWFTETDISIAHDPELLDLLAQSGCKEVLIGIESPDGSGLDGIESRSNWKAKQAPRAREAVRCIQSRGVRVNACFVLGLDGQGPGVFDAVFDFVTDVIPFDVQITLATPLPGTPFHRRLETEGRLRPATDWRQSTLFDLAFEPIGMTYTELRDGFRDLVSRLYTEEMTDWRIEAYKERYLHGREPAPPPLPQPQSLTVISLTTAADRAGIIPRPSP